jgi:hypothetical protein
LSGLEEPANIIDHAAQKLIDVRRPDGLVEHRDLFERRERAELLGDAVRRLPAFRALVDRAVFLL